MTSADSYGHTHTHVLTADFFSQTRRLSWIPYTLSHSPHWTSHLILSSPPHHHLFFYFNSGHAVPDELRTLCSGIKRVPILQNTCYLLQASIWKRSHKSNYLPWKSRTPQVHQVPFYSSSRTLQTRTIVFSIGIRFTTQQQCSCTPSAPKTTTTHTPEKQRKLTKQQSAITPYPWLQPFSEESSPSACHPWKRRHHSAYNPSSACSRNADVTCQMNPKMKSIFTFLQAVTAELQCTVCSRLISSSSSSSSSSSCRGALGWTRIPGPQIG